MINFGQLMILINSVNSVILNYLCVLDSWLDKTIHLNMALKNKGYCICLQYFDI